MTILLWKDYPLYEINDYLLHEIWLSWFILHTNVLYLDTHLWGIVMLCSLLWHLHVDFRLYLLTHDYHACSTLLEMTFIRLQGSQPFFSSRDFPSLISDFSNDCPMMHITTLLFHEYVSLYHSFKTVLIMPQWMDY